MRLLLSLICSVALGSVPYIIYWMGGGNFEREYFLALATLFAMLLLPIGFIMGQQPCGKKEQDNV